MFRSLLSFSFLCLLFSCTLEPHYDVPCVELSQEWKNQQPEGEAIAASKEHWWEVFDDPVLVGYVQTAIEKNQDLIAANERIEQARALAKIERSKLFPFLSTTLGYSNLSVLDQLYGPGLLPYFPFITREHQREYSLPVTMTYEPDIWGKIRSAYKSASLHEEERQEAYRAGLLSVTTELANAYFQVRILDALAERYQAIIVTRKKTLEIDTDRFQGELYNFSPVAVADQDLNQVEAHYFEVKQRRAIFENMIAVLLGMSASEFKMEVSPLEVLPPNIPKGIPCEILFRRPDLAEQQRRMAAVHALLGVSYAEFFPRVDLEGAGGTDAPLSKYFFKSGSSFWMIGASITEALFEGLARIYKVKLNWAQFHEVVASYRQNCFVAFKEVEDALSNLQWVAQEMDRFSEAIGAAKVDHKIAADRFRFGINSNLMALQKERVELENEIAYLTLLGGRYMNTVQLIRALGGGW